MANPQKENGYTAIANEIFDRLGSIKLLGSEYQVIICVLRKTYGWQKKEDYISLSQFEEFTNLSRPTVVSVIKNLLENRFLIKINNKFSFNKDWEKWGGKAGLTSKAGLTRTSKHRLTIASKAGLTHKRKLKKDKTIGVLPITEKEIMYNYQNIDESGNPITNKRIGKISKSENEFLISIGFLWRDMIASHFNMQKSDVLLLNIYYPIRSAYDREKWNKEDFKELFTFFLEDKMPDEMKISFDLCLSQKYIAKFKLKKQLRSKPKNNASLSSEIKL